LGDRPVSSGEIPHDILEFIEREHQRLQEFQKQKFGAPILRIEEGKVYDLVLDISEQWKMTTTRFGERVVIPVIFENQKYVLMLNPVGSVYRQIIEQLAKKMREAGTEKIQEVRLFLKRASGRYTVVVDVVVESGKSKKQK
jgi:hypothetical protein